MKKFLPFIIFAFVIISDQASKIAVRNSMGPGKKLEGQHIPLIGKFFSINFHENKGVAFGLFSKLPTKITVPIFILITIGAIFLIAHFYRSLPKNKLLPRVSLMMILGGAIGNLIDRIALGKVTDFLDLATYDLVDGRVINYKNIWPIFNIADSFIVIGVTILIILMIKERKEEKLLKNTESEDTANDIKQKESIS